MIKEYKNNLEDKLLLTVACQVVNVEGMTELESHHLAAIKVIIKTGKNNQRMLKLAGRSLLKNLVFTYSQSICLLHTINYKGKKQ